MHFFVLFYANIYCPTRTHYRADEDMPLHWGWKFCICILYLLEYVSDVMTSVTTAVCLPVHPNFGRYLARWSFICQFVELMWCWYFPTSPLQMMEATGGTGAAFYHSIIAITSPQHQPFFNHNCAAHQIKNEISPITTTKQNIWNQFK